MLSRYRPFSSRWGPPNKADAIVITDLEGELDEEGSIRGNLDRTKLLEPPTEATKGKPSTNLATDRILDELKGASRKAVSKLNKTDSRGWNRFRGLLHIRPPDA